LKQGATEQNELAKDRVWWRNWR